MEKINKNKDLDKKFDQFWDESKFSKLEKEKSEAIYNSITKELNFEKSKGYRNLYKYVAIFVVTISVVSYFTFINKDNTVATNTVEEKSELKVAFNEQLITLQDESIVNLHPNSKLTYPSKFNDSIREVVLEGSALFNIAKDEQKPFIVYQGELITEVLGTSFLIKDDSISNITKIYLHTGKIAITNKSKIFNRVLYPGDSLIYNNLINEEIIKEQLLPKEIFINANEAITNRISISFVDTKLKDAYKRIQVQTGIKIDYSNIGIGGELILSLNYKDQIIDKIVNDLNSFNGYSYEIVNNILIIKK